MSKFKGCKIGDWYLMSTGKKILYFQHLPCKWIWHIEQMTEFPPPPCPHCRQNLDSYWPALRIYFD